MKSPCVGYKRQRIRYNVLVVCKERKVVKKKRSRGEVGLKGWYEMMLGPNSSQLSSGRSG
jgi:hypothetical protein